MSMRRTLTVAALAACAAPLHAQPGARADSLGPGRVVAGRTVIVLPDTSRYSAVARRVVALERERSAAIARGDTTWLATLYAPDFGGVVANGLRVDRGQLFRVFGRDDPSSRFLIDELAVRDFGGAVTVTGRLATLTPAGAVARASRYLHVYVRRGGRWQLVAAEGTAVPSDTTRPAAAAPAASQAGSPPRRTFAAVYSRGPAYAAGTPIFEQRGVREHVAHHEALGPRLVAAGPLRARDADTLVGIIVFCADDERAAEEWLARDPAIVSGVLVGIVREWGARRCAP